MKKVRYSFKFYFIYATVYLQKFIRKVKISKFNVFYDTRYYMTMSHYVQLLSSETETAGQRGRHCNER